MRPKGSGLGLRVFSDFPGSLPLPFPLDGSIGVSLLAAPAAPGTATGFFVDDGLEKSQSGSLSSAFVLFIGSSFPVFCKVFMNLSNLSIRPASDLPELRHFVCCMLLRVRA